MNSKNLATIFQQYEENFDTFNQGKRGGESFKWLIAKEFPVLMDKALESSNEDFPAALLQVKKLATGLIENGQHLPFHGLCEIAKQAPSEVRQMFVDLYADVGGSRLKSIDKIVAFIRKSDELLTRYYPQSHLYQNDLHSVSAYAFLYDPENNYLYKYKEAKAFADCTEYEGEIGGSEAIRLDAFYRMCDELVKAIKADEKLLSTANQRYEGKFGLNHDELHQDTSKHILAFDIIWCCGKYKLLDGIEYEHRSQQERSEYERRLREARAAYTALQESERKQILLTEALLYLRKAFGVGSKVTNKANETGTVTKYEDTGMTVALDSGTKNFGPIPAFCNGALRADLPGFDNAVEKYREALAKRNYTESDHILKLGNFKPYEDLLEVLMDD